MALQMTTLSTMSLSLIQHKQKEMLVSLEIFLKDIIEWMSQNHFKMNLRKTEFMYFGLRVQLSKCKELQSKYVKMKLREAVTSIY